MELPLIGQAGLEGFYNVNFYFSPELENGGSGLVNTPGLKLYYKYKEGSEIRGMHDMDGVLYVVAGNTVYHWNGGISTTCTGTLSDSSGHVWMCDNGTQVMIVNSSKGYYVTGTTVTAITDADFPIPSSLCYQDGYGIVTQSGTGKIYISTINDFSNWDALDYTTAEAEPDDALSVFSSHREVYVFGKESTETYYNSGNADFPFERIQGGYIERGIGAAHTPVKADNTIIWLSNRRQVLQTPGPGHSPVVISTPQLHKEFEGYAKIDDAFAYAMDILGYTWYVLTFPSQNRTYVYNFATKRWHQWAGFSAGVETRHYGNCYVYHDNKHLVGHFNNGSVYSIDPTVYTDYGRPFRSIATFPTIIKEGKRIFHHKLQIDFKAGVGITTGQGSDPQAMLRWSDDRMRTWSSEHWASIGKLGEYGARSVWRRLGHSMERNYQVTISDPVERVIYGAYLNPGIEPDDLQVRRKA